MADLPEKLKARITESRVEARWFSCAHRLAVALHPAYAEHYSKWKNGDFEERTELPVEGLDNFFPALSGRQALQLRWGLHGEEPPSPFREGQGNIDEDKAEDFLESLKVLEEHSVSDERYPSGYDDTLEYALYKSDLGFERFLSSHILGIYFDRTASAYWQFGGEATEKPYQVPKLYGDDQVRWGVVNFELGARTIWHCIVDSLDIDFGGAYRVLPARQSWFPPSEQTAVSIGRSHLLLGVQDISSWLPENLDELEEKTSQYTGQEPFFDPATSTRIEGEPAKLEERLEDARRSPLHGPLNFVSNEEGRAVIQRLRQLSRLCDILAGLSIKPMAGAKVLLGLALEGYLQEEHPNLAVLAEYVDNEPLIRFCAQNVFLVSLSDGQPARNPEGNIGPSEQIREESQQLGVQTFSLLSKELKKRVHEYQEDALCTLSRCFDRHLSDLFEDMHATETSFTSNHHLLRSLLFIHGVPHFDANALRAIFADTQRTGSSPPPRRQKLKLLLSVIYYAIFKHSDLSLEDIALSVGRGTGTIQSRIGQDQTADSFVKSRDLWS